MDPLLEICKILIVNIAENQEEIKSHLINNLKEIKNPVYNRELNLVHIKDHSDDTIILKNCWQTHCLECLHSFSLEYSYCEHGCLITPYEKAFISTKVKCIPYVKQVVFKIQRCLFCKSVYYTQKDKQCECQLCSECIVMKYGDLEISCEICAREYTHDEIRKISYSIGRYNVELAQKCPSCNLVLYSNSFIDNYCFVCSLSANHNIF